MKRCEPLKEYFAHHKKDLDWYCNYGDDVHMERPLLEDMVFAFFHPHILKDYDYIRTDTMEDNNTTHRGFLFLDREPVKAARQTKESQRTDYFIPLEYLRLAATAPNLQMEMNSIGKRINNLMDDYEEQKTYLKSTKYYGMQGLAQPIICGQSDDTHAPDQPKVYRSDLIRLEGKDDPRIPRLKDEGCIILPSYDMRNSQQALWAFQPAGNESPEHTCLALQISAWLKEQGIENRVNHTEDADVEFQNPKGQKIGVEVYTQTILSKPDKLQEKITRYNQLYHTWVIVATSQKVARELKKMNTQGIPVMERKDIIDFLKTQI
jgi:hypothetical protein